MEHEIEEIISELEYILCGLNYQTTFGINVLNDCSTTDVFRNQLQQIYSSSNALHAELNIVTQHEFLTEIDYGLDFRGVPQYFGFEVNKEENGILLEIQKRYLTYIFNHISDSTLIYSYPEDKGIPGYVVYWRFAFAIINANSPSLFIYGSASD